MQINLPIGFEDSLIWWHERGMGFHPRPPIDYQADYWQEYRERDATPMGEALTKARVDFVRKHIGSDIQHLVDIGIGGGRFVREADCWGFDVNESAIEWLRSHNAFTNPMTAPPEAISCWDALEHIPKPEKLLKHVKNWLFVSLPIFDNPATITASKHYKPGEHIWYFTHRGLVIWCAAQGFELIEYNHIESDLGREGITSYAFKRRL
jgi:hypothetical protein